MPSPLPTAVRRPRGPASRRLARLAALLTAAVVASGCTAGQPGGAAPPTTAAAPSASSPSSPSSAGARTPTSGAGGSDGERAGATYVALGDSYTAAPLVPVTDTSDGCLQSSGNYPHLVAEELDYALADVSCVGATSASLIGVQQVPGGGVRPPQFDALGPGTELVTIGVGGNDVGLLTTLAGTCFPLAPQDPSGSPCTERLRGTPADLLDAVAELDDRIEAIVAGVRERAPRAQVVVVTYPQLIPAQGTCEEAPLADGDYAYVRRVITALSTALRRGARAAQADVVDVLALSRGHDVCSEEPWVNGARTDSGQALAFHPFAVEQQAVADAVVELVD